jgi:hypothetical protein
MILTIFNKLILNGSVKKEGTLLHGSPSLSSGDYFYLPSRTGSFTCPNDSHLSWLSCLQITVDMEQCYGCETIDVKKGTRNEKRVL